MNSLHAGASSESEDNLTLSTSSTPYKNPFYGKALGQLIELYGAEIASRILPAYLDKEETSSDWDFRSSDEPSYDDVVQVMKPMNLAQVRFGVRTLLPKINLKMVKGHFSFLKSILRANYFDLERSLCAAEQTHLHKAPNLHAIMGVMTKVESFDPGKAVILWDLHGTLTRSRSPQKGVTNVKSRKLASKIIHDLDHSGSTNVIVSAWDDMDEVVAQVRHNGFAEIFQIPAEYQVLEGQLKINDDLTIFYKRVGSLISVKTDQSHKFYKDKIYALDVLGLNPETVFLIDDSWDNCSKAALHFGNTQTSQTARAFHVVDLGEVKGNEPSHLGDDLKVSWMNLLNLSE